MKDHPMKGELERLDTRIGDVASELKRLDVKILAEDERISLAMSSEPPNERAVQKHQLERIELRHQHERKLFLLENLRAKRSDVERDIATWQLRKLAPERSAIADVYLALLVRIQEAINVIPAAAAEACAAAARYGKINSRMHQLEREFGVSLPPPPASSYAQPEPQAQAPSIDALIRQLAELGGNPVNQLGDARRFVSALDMTGSWREEGTQPPALRARRIA